MSDETIPLYPPRDCRACGGKGTDERVSGIVKCPGCDGTGNIAVRGIPRPENIVVQAKMFLRKRTREQAVREITQDRLRVVEPGGSYWKLRGADRDPRIAAEMQESQKFWRDVIAVVESLPASLERHALRK